MRQPHDGMHDQAGLLSSRRNRKPQDAHRGTVIRHLLLVSVCLYGALWARAQADAPTGGRTERKAVLGALRSAVRQELKRPVVFRVDHLKVQHGWAFMRGVPRRPSGGPMNYQGTPYHEAIKQGVFDDWICALLQKQRGRWRVVAYAIGATDVPYAGWAQQYHAPPEIFN